MPIRAHCAGARRAGACRARARHYNQTAAEYSPADRDEIRRDGGTEHHTWPAGSAYPDYFFFGDPHINFYEGTVEFDDLDLYVPDER